MTYENNKYIVADEYDKGIKMLRRALNTKNHERILQCQKARPQA